MSAQAALRLEIQELIRRIKELENKLRVRALPFLARLRVLSW